MVILIAYRLLSLLEGISQRMIPLAGFTYASCTGHAPGATAMLGDGQLLLVGLSSGTLQVHEILGEIF